MAHVGKLPTFQRLVTGHDDNGKAVIAQIDPNAPWQTNIEGGRAAFCQAYVTKGFPVDLNEDKDIMQYQVFLKDPPGIVSNNGTVLRIVVSRM